MLALTLLPATLAVAPAVAQDAGTGAALVVDKELAKAGKDVWTQKMCIGCHTIGQGRLAGPDLMQVTERRPLEWLQTFLKDPEPMLDNDPVAKELLKEANNLRMPNMKLTDAEIMAVLHYIAEQSEAKK
ncbi:MAG: c-type cytochrome [Longimicrobiales bacterium]